MTGTRRELLGGGIAAATAFGLGAAFWGDVFGAARSGARSRGGSGYGARGPVNEHGLRLPQGFRSRLVARGGEPVGVTGYRWHEASDGMACFAAEDGGWILVSNSEAFRGGASAVRFDARGEVRGAYLILDGTQQNCSGGATPWGTWLSCEEVESGLVWECDPEGTRNEIDFDVGTVGNHEFDEGGAELMRLLRGGRRTGAEAFNRDVDGCIVNTSAPGFGGARFPYIGANTFTDAGGCSCPRTRSSSARGSAPASSG